MILCTRDDRKPSLYDVFDAFSIIPCILTYVPVMNPTNPNKIKNIFLGSLHLRPGFSYSVIKSIIDGKIKPNIERHNAPTNEMKPSRSGTRMAITTVSITNEIRMEYSDRLGRLTNKLFKLFQIISIGT